MRSSKTCKRVILAGGDGCQVVYCEDCNVAELEVGAISLRLEAHAFKTLAQIIEQAATRLALFNSRNSMQNEFTAGPSNVH